MECDSFRRAAGKTWQEKAEEACTNCRKCKGNFPLNPEDAIEVESNDFLIEEIGELVKADNAGNRFNFANTDYIRGSLFVEWVNTEKEIQRLHSLRMQAFLKGWMEPKK